MIKNRIYYYQGYHLKLCRQHSTVLKRKLEVVSKCWRRCMLIIVYHSAVKVQFNYLLCQAIFWLTWTLILYIWCFSHCDKNGVEVCYSANSILKQQKEQMQSNSKPDETLGRWKAGLFVPPSLVLLCREGGKRNLSRRLFRKSTELCVCLWIWSLKLYFSLGHHALSLIGMITYL